jgi:hypothetical protein
MIYLRLIIKLYVCQDACLVRVDFASEVKQRSKNSIARSLPTRLGVAAEEVTQLAPSGQGIKSAITAIKGRSMSAGSLCAVPTSSKASISSPKG